MESGETSEGTVLDEDGKSRKEHFRGIFVIIYIGTDLQIGTQGY
jgi:hypothetical protein